ncbi:SOS response-associated peptidase [Butyrivibrio sp. JL13D10]|uniref:SOS response-associated peptidase n=1 Tax=Butyrivibrio sp. JL13D10 TaxID=3236815 RepID=UPI0038B61893
MCCRYYFSDKIANQVEDELHILGEAFISGAGDVTPGMVAPGIIHKKNSDADIVFADLFWGISSKDKKLIINARTETVTGKPMFSESFRNRRCILPAEGFYEWDADKTKFVFTRADKRTIYLAGLYDRSENRDSFVILTAAANASMKPVHDRMPVMVDKEKVRDYLKDSSAAMEIINEPMPELYRYSDYEQLSLF